MLAENRTFLTPLLEGCLSKLAEIESSPFKASLSDCILMLEAIVQRSFTLRPECFVHPKMWYHHITLLRRLLDSDGARADSTISYDRSFESISSRNDAITFRSLPHRAAASLRSTIVDIQVLSSIGPTTNLREIRFLSTEQENETWSETFNRKLNTLLTWSVTARSGEQPIYVAACILSDWLHQTAPKRTSNPKKFLHESLLAWLDASETARDHSNYLNGISLLYGELVRRDLISYLKIVQKVIARGDSLSKSDGPSHLAVMLQAIPLTSPPGAYSLRAAALYGITNLEEDDINVVKLQREWIRVLPEFNLGTLVRRSWVSPWKLTMRYLHRSRRIGSTWGFSSHRCQHL